MQLPGRARRGRRHAPECASRRCQSRLPRPVGVARRQRTERLPSASTSRRALHTGSDAGHIQLDLPAAANARIQQTLELVGLDDKADRPIKGFSGGERQRLGIAQAQINYPDLLILDEPAASLDPMGRRDVLEVMERLRKHTTVFYSTHILDDVHRVSDTVVIINHAQMVAHAPIGELLAGKDGIVYSLIVKGDGQSTKTQLAQQAWIKSVTTTSTNGTTALQVNVSDAGAAESQ